MLDKLIAQPLSKSSLVCLLVWIPPPHAAYISSPSQCLLFAAHAHTIATCFAVVSRLYHLLLVCVSTLYLELYLTPHFDHKYYNVSLSNVTILFGMHLWIGQSSKGEWHSDIQWKRTMAQKVLGTTVHLLWHATVACYWTVESFQCTILWMISTAKWRRGMLTVAFAILFSQLLALSSKNMSCYDSVLINWLCIGHYGRPA